MQKSTIEALRDKKLLTTDQLQEIEDEWVFGSSLVIPGLIAHIRRQTAALDPK
jgi:hypothetical protein